MCVHCKFILFTLLNCSEVQYNVSYCSPFLVSTELTFLDLIHFAKIFQTTKRFAMPFDSYMFLDYIYSMYASLYNQNLVIRKEITGVDFAL